MLDRITFLTKSFHKNWPSSSWDDQGSERPWNMHFLKLWKACNVNNTVAIMTDLTPPFMACGCMMSDVIIGPQRQLSQELLGWF